MSDYQIFSDYIPVADAGKTVTLKPSQTLLDGTTDLLQLDQPSPVVSLKIEGPQLKLTPADIAGVYPAAGSEESPDEFLPHIALERRTLPWERIGVNGQKPWLALMLFKESEMRDAVARKSSPAATLESVLLSDVSGRDPAGYATLHTTLGLPATTPLNVLFVKNSVLVTRRPNQADIKYMSHVRRDLATGKDRAIVISSRLPDAGPAGSEPEIHTAFLVSLERRDDLYAAARATAANANNEAVLVVLHHWSFTPSQGGDFEQVIRSIAIRPNGGVLRFGNLPKEVTGGPAPLSGGFQGLLRSDGYFLDPLTHTHPGNVTWRGPLRPFAPPPRNHGFAVRAAPEEFENPQPNDPQDHSHASAFELGRLLALARPEILEDLRAIHLSFPPIEPEVAVNKLPPALQKPDWVSNPAWTEEPWSMDVNGQLQSIVKDENQFLGKGIADVGGIAQQAGGWVNEVVVDLGAMGTPVAAPVTQIDIGTVTPQGLGNLFPEVETAGLA